MVRFLVVMVLALGLCAGAAYLFDLPPFGPKSPPANAQQRGTQEDGKPAKAPELGGSLYARVAPRQFAPLGDELLAGPNAGRLGRQIVVPDCLIVPFDKQDVASSK